MKKINRVFDYLYLFICLAFAFSINAFAYIDPATTAMIVQIVSGIFISLGVAFAIFRRKIAIFFKSLFVKFTQKKIEKEQKKNGENADVD